MHKNKTENKTENKTYTYLSGTFVENKNQLVMTDKEAREVVSIAGNIAWKFCGSKW